MNILENFKMALESIRANKMRSFLTMLGIIIGISSVITIISLGQGGRESIIGEFEKMGANNISITVDMNNAQSSDYITLKDIAAIREKVDTVKYISPSIQQRGRVSSENKTKAASITGSNQDNSQINNFTIVYGRYFNEHEVQNGKAVAIIDDKSALELFGNEDAVGKTIKIGPEAASRKVTIIGIKQGIDMGPGGRNSAAIDIPITFYKNLYADNYRIMTLTLTGSSKEEAQLAGQSAVNILESRHHNRGQEIYQRANILDRLSQINNILGIFTTFIVAVAAISLLVGGIGVMNIMLVSVTERTREIGIRKAIGATTKSILLQFLTESSIISLIGGVIGMILGFLGSQIIGIIAGVTPSISITVIIGVILFSSSIGIFFGIYPAKKAANLNPIDALRYE